jgi:hypothetical protein
MLTCVQVEGMKGPDNDGCDCAACAALAMMKGRLVDVVREFDAQHMEGMREDAGDRFTSPWSLVVCIAAGRLRAQHCPAEAIIDMAVHGIQNAEDQNALLLAPAAGGVS